MVLQGFPIIRLYLIFEDASVHIKYLSVKEVFKLECLIPASSSKSFLLLFQ